MKASSLEAPDAGPSVISTYNGTKHYLPLLISNE